MSAVYILTGLCLVGSLWACVDANRDARRAEAAARRAEAALRAMREER